VGDFQPRGERTSTEEPVDLVENCDSNCGRDGSGAADAGGGGGGGGAGIEGEGRISAGRGLAGGTATVTVALTGGGLTSGSDS